MRSEEQRPTNSSNDHAIPNAARQRRSRTINILALVTHINACTAWSGALRFNLLTENYEVRPPFPPRNGGEGPPRPLDEPHDILRAAMYFQANGFARAGKGVVWDALAAVAHEHSYHPVRDYLNGLRWDGIERLGGLFLRYFNAELPEDPGERDRQLAYLEHISIGFMVGAVARAMIPGCKVDNVPVVVGHDQGLLKSTAVRALCHDPAWFSDNISPDLIDRDTKESLRGKWIIELAEFPHIRRETERVKAFFSSQVDRYRAAYGRANQDHPRQCVFIGTSNDLEFVDVTGNRRFWPFVATGPIDVTAIERDRDQLWAEATSLYARGERWWLPPKIEVIASERQEEFVESDIWDGLIHDWTEKHTGPFTMKDLFAIDTGITPYRDVAAVTRVDEMRAARCLKKLGFTKRQKMIGGKRGTWWQRP
jgi:predicted P-loop ATPase